MCVHCQANGAARRERVGGNDNSLVSREL